MAAKIVTIGCRLPHGIILDHPLDPTKKVELKGKNGAMIIGAEHGTTEVDGEFWETWKTVHKNFPALTSGAIFEAKNVADAASIAKELKDEKTGFEPMRTDGKDERASGVKTATEGDKE